MILVKTSCFRFIISLTVNWKLGKIFAKLIWLITDSLVYEDNNYKKRLREGSFKKKRPYLALRANRGGEVCQNTNLLNRF